MPGRPAKTLIQHVQDGTFRPSRHGELLETDPLPPELAQFGDRYRIARSVRERQAVALEFRDAIAGADIDDDATLMEILDAPLEPHMPERDRAAAERAYRVLYARDAHRSGMPEKGEEWRLTVPEIAERLGVSRTTVRRYLAEVAERERLDELESEPPAWGLGKRA